MPRVTTPPVIDVKGLSKQYGGSRILALDKISLQVRAGEVYGFLGPNGAGKSTAIRCLLNFIQPTAGSASILGKDVVRESVAIKAHIGYLAGDVVMYSKMTGRQFLDYMVAMQPLKHPGFLTALVREFRAELNRPLELLSKGNRQKLGVIQAFMHEPEVLVLDEPTSGLDPLMQEVFYRLVANAKARGASVFVSSHNLPEVQRMCDRTGFIREGKLVAEKTLADLAKTAAHTFDLTFMKDPPLAELKRLPRAQVALNHDPKHVTVVMQGDLAPLFGVLSRHRLQHFNQRDVSLESEFLRLYKKGAKR
jgi:ABC-2 type transport system ATP-binding protein